jgi:ribosome maturation factor RimP
MAVALREKLIGLVEPLLGNLGYELVELEFAAGRGSGMLRVFIDRLSGSANGTEPVGIEDCERVSREISALMDVHDPIPTAYRLEVSTPGLDRVLRTPAHFARFVGSRVEVELAVPRDGRRRYTGRLALAGPAGIELNVDGTLVPLGYAEVFRARMVPEWPDNSSKGRKR